MKSVDDLVPSGKMQWMAEEKRSDLIRAFRQNAERSVSSAVAYLICAIPSGAAVAYYAFRAQNEFGRWDALQVISLSVTFLFCVASGVRKLWMSPRDQLLLLLLDEALERSKPIESNAKA